MRCSGEDCLAPMARALRDGGKEPDCLDCARPAEVGEGIILMIRLFAGMDANGNSRRVIVGLAPSGNIVRAWRGKDRFPVGSRLRGLEHNGPEFRSTPGEVRDTIREYGKGD